MASSIVDAAMVLCALAPEIVVSTWKNGPVSAASTSGGVLNVPSPKICPLGSESVPNPPSCGEPIWLVRAASTPVLKLRLPPPPNEAFAPALSCTRA
jgi:hypothetical protein